MEKYLKDLNKGETSSYQYFEKEDISNRDWKSVTIDTCNIAYTSISNVSLVNSDIIGTTFEECCFNEIDFSHADLCTVLSEKVRYNNVKFDVSAIRDCEFSFCEFDECTFEHVAMTCSKFENCIFKNIKINQSSSYLNDFINCQFIDCQFMGNFFYSMFINCEFDYKFISDKLLAYNIISPTMNYKVSNNNILQTELIENKMFINIEIYKLNQAIINPDKFIFESLVAIHKLISNSIVVRVEQIDFIRKISEYFSHNNMIATITIVQALSIIDKIIESSTDKSNAFKKSTDNLNHLKNTLFLEYINRINETPLLTIDFTRAQPILYKVTYEEEPEIELSDIINKTLQNMGISSVKATRISSEHGCFIEILQFIKDAEPLIQLILSFTTGIIVPIVAKKIKEKKEKDDRSLIDNSSHYNGKNIIVINNPTYNLINISSNQNSCAAVTQVLLDNNITVNDNFKGYSRENIRSIEIVNNDDDNT